MAKVEKNVIIEGLSGSLADQLVIYQRGGRTIVRTKGRRTAPPSEAQLAHQERFREAAAYAKATQGQPAYVEKAASTGQAAYNVAVADFLHPPEILDVDLAGYTGKPGETIRIRARDDLKVNRVSVLIADANDEVVEQGNATQGAIEDWWWEYRTTAACSTPSAKVVAHVEDLAGHFAEREEIK